jgi:hypothetical protein
MAPPGLYREASTCSFFLCHKNQGKKAKYIHAMAVACKTPNLLELTLLFASNCHSTRRIEVIAFEHASQATTTNKLATFAISH